MLTRDHAGTSAAGPHGGWGDPTCGLALLYLPVNPAAAGLAPGILGLGHAAVAHGPQEGIAGLDLLADGQVVPCLAPDLGQVEGLGLPFRDRTAQRIERLFVHFNLHRSGHGTARTGQRLHPRPAALRRRPIRDILKKR